MKKTLVITFVSLCLALCLIPSVGLLFWGESRPVGNEMRIPKPSLATEDQRLNKDLLSEMSTYYAASFPLRPELITLDAKAAALLTGSSENDAVILGSSGWLFFSETLDDFMGVSISDDELDRIAEYLSGLQKRAEANGVRLLFTVAPNKNSVAPEHMPAYIQGDHDNSSLSRLVPILEEYGINYVDLFKTLEGRADLYYTTDSHWTREGAAVAADTLASTLGVSTDYAGGPFVPDGTHHGDLYSMLYPSLMDQEPELAYAGPLTYTTSKDPLGGEAIRFRTENEGGYPLRVFCYRDSFGVNLYPFLAGTFAEVTFSRETNYGSDAVLETGNYDVVIIEIVERNLYQLAEIAKD